MTELWLVDLEAVAPALEALERDVPRLPADDRDRAGRLSDQRERRQRLAAYVALRVLLERVDGSGVRGQRFIRPPGGKPRLRAAGPDFSLSHAGSLALIGVARSQAIGVDLEEARTLAMSWRRREEILAVGTGLVTQPAGDAGSDAAVLQAWCRLEAYAKATGLGIARVLGELGLREPHGRQLPPAAIEAAARRLVREAALTVGDVKLPPGLHGAVAYAGLGVAPRLRRFPAERRAIARLLLPAGTARGR
jgi:4'-phosphopantetheinyl transferase